MPTGECPECKKIVALSAKSCRNCGNRDFLVKSGNKLFIYCRECSGKGCRVCAGKGYTVGDQTVDVRNPTELSNATRNAERHNQDLLANLQKQKVRLSEKLKEEERQRVLRDQSNEQKKREERIKKAGNRSITILVLGLVLAFLSFFVVGAGGCVVRIMIKNPSDRDYDMYFPFASWTREAVIIPILIIIVAAIAAYRVKPASISTD